ncbi:DMT family transporter [Thioalbus denitrificans]|uniref:EamA domain-containing membrane protein RarD n=1 Tax=Thioalbus denitrificans TaxID=547122 RepID=A0A369CIS0_9GAMM|nr:DMT family transporter [Thioalbus denitrificans]RCX33593.1 EamA domain-containing membrane protein RarD [Thioalbus denitrificans]
METAVDSHALHRRGLLVVGVGVLVISFDALLIRLAAAGAWEVAFWRGALMALSLGLIWGLLGKRRRGAGRLLRGPALAAVMLLGINGCLFVLAIMHTTVANTVVILSTAPLFAALFTRLFLGEPVVGRTWGAIVICMTGTVAVFAGSLRGGGLEGDLAALAAALNFGAILVLLRRHPGLPRIPLVGASGLVMAVVSLPFAAPLELGAGSYAVLALMGLVQMPLALVLITRGTDYLPAPEVGLMILVETLLGPLWVWLGVGERPALITLVGGLLIVSTLAVHGWLGLRADHAGNR